MICLLPVLPLALSLSAELNDWTKMSLLELEMSKRTNERVRMVHKLIGSVATLQCLNDNLKNEN